MQKFARLIATAAAFTLAALLIIDSHAAVQGASAALTLCSGVLIPSLFPFMVTASFIAELEPPECLKRLFTPVLRLLFRQPCSAAPAILLGLTGGYPIGARMAQRLLDRGEITGEQAHRLTLFCVNAGPSFVIGAVGGSMLSSTSAGIIIFAALCLSSLFLGMLTRFIPGACADEPRQDEKAVSQSLTNSLVGSISDGCAGIVTVSAWVIFFGSVCALLSQSGARTVIMCILEVTGGCFAVGNISLPVIASVLGFGGLCVHCQIFSLASRISIKPLLFFCSRVLNAVFAAFICEGIVKLLPQSVSVIAGTGETLTAAASVSAPAACALLFLCSLVILELDTCEKV